jgi:U3 small nucleolar RNA-associated protein 20
MFSSEEFVYKTSKNNLSGGLVHTSQVSSLMVDSFSSSASQNAKKKFFLGRLGVAVAVVKLLIRIPRSSGLITLHLPPLILSLSNLLKSRLEDTRAVVRRTLVNMMLILGPLYFGYVMQEMRRILRRGYQVHVLVYTLKTILLEIVKLIKLKHSSRLGVQKSNDDFGVKAGEIQSFDTSKFLNIDYCLEELSEIIFMELFGIQSEEKEVDKLTRSYVEMRSTSGYDMLQIV